MARSLQLQVGQGRTKSSQPLQDQIEIFRVDVIASILLKALTWMFVHMCEYVGMFVCVIHMLCVYTCRAAFRGGEGGHSGGAFRGG